MLPHAAPLAAVHRVLDVVRLFARQALKAMKGAKKMALFGAENMALEVPYCVEVNGAVFSALSRILSAAVDDVRSFESRVDAVPRAVANPAVVSIRRRGGGACS